MKIVLDTNILLMSIPKISPYRIIFDAIVNGDIDLYVTNDILLEYIEKIEEKSSVAVAQNIAKLLKTLKNAHFQEVFYQWNLIEADPDDNKFVDCFVVSNANYLVSNDGHFRVLKTIDFPSVQIVSAKEFVEILLAKS